MEEIGFVVVRPSGAVGKLDVFAGFQYKGGGRLEAIWSEAPKYNHPIRVYTRDEVDHAADDVVGTVPVARVARLSVTYLP